MNYTFSRSFRTYNDINNNNPFDFNYNRTHNIKLSFNHRLSEFSEFLFNFHLGSGTYYSQPEEIIFIPPDQYQVVYKSKNNAKLPSYQRLDIGIAFYNPLKFAKSKLFIGAYNALNSKNPFFIELSRNANDPNNPYELKSYSLLSLLPTISYSLSF